MTAIEGFAWGITVCLAIAGVVWLASQNPYFFPPKPEPSVVATFQLTELESRRYVAFWENLAEERKRTLEQLSSATVSSPSAAVTWSSVRINQPKAPMARKRQARRKA